jgi:hypothetical protein
MKLPQILQSHQENQILLLVDMLYLLEYAQLQTLQLHLGQPVGKSQELILEQGQEAALQLDQIVVRYHIHKQVIAVFHTKVLGLDGYQILALEVGQEQMLLMQTVIQGPYMKPSAEANVVHYGEIKEPVEMLGRPK